MNKNKTAIGDIKNQKIICNFISRYNKMLLYYDYIDSNSMANLHISSLFVRLEKNSLKTLKNLKEWLNTYNAGYCGQSCHDFNFLLLFTEDDFAYIKQLSAKMSSILSEIDILSITSVISREKYNISA